MKRINFKLLTLLLILGLVLTGCGNEKDINEGNNSQTENNEQHDEAEAAFPVTIEDASGDEITIEEEPEAIVSLMPSNTEMAYALGLGDEVVGVSDHDNYPEDVLEKEKIGGLELNIEAILALEPDLVLALPTNDEEGITQLEESGLTVLTLNEATNFEEVYETIDMMASATGTEAEGEEIIASMKEDLASLEDKASEIDEDDMKKVYIEISPEPETFTPGKGTFEHEILTKINAVNIAEKEDGWVELNEEAIVKENPDVIILTYDYVEDPVEELLNRDAWQDIDAVKNEQVYLVDEDLVSRPGPRLVEGAETLAKEIYPEVFTE